MPTACSRTLRITAPVAAGTPTEQVLKRIASFLRDGKFSLAEPTFVPGHAATRADARASLPEYHWGTHTRVSMRLGVVLLAFFLAGLAPRTNFALKFMKEDPVAANGDCLPGLKEDADSILQRNMVALEGVPHPSVKVAVARIVALVEGISKGNFGFEWRGYDGSKSPEPIKIVFYMNEWLYSEVSSNEPVLRIRPNRQNLKALRDQEFGGVQNHSMLAHEIGHHLTLKEGYRLQRQYEAEVPSACLPTMYSSTKRYTQEAFSKSLRAEETAEVFAAFLTNPNVLVGVSPACDMARKFFAGLLQEPVERSLSCEARKHSLDSWHRERNRRNGLSAQK